MWTTELIQDQSSAEAVEVHQDDTPKSLQLRVMEEAEWVIMPRAIDLIANGKVKVEGGKALIEQ